MTTLYGHQTPNTTVRALHWTDNALCRDSNNPDAFFPAGSGATAKQQIDAAKAFCTGCPVRMACATTAIENGWDSGVWGALDEVQRRRITRQRPADLQKAIRTAWAARFNPYFDAYAKRTEQEEDGHVRWLVKNTSITVLGRNYTPGQLGLMLARGREAHGTTQTVCGRPGCVAGEHLADDIVRWDRSRDTYKTAA
ncbi:WhiB family transcriptional regulator [Streptomyces xanthophaeus]|uniref:WhiB family transcriptional regulator n=1 Tax=Streptomyces xanthophaeus TaxID=67385 RepID=UPI002647D1B4|nr:WhiB family transcriptional regulator [Streptomyces xanthophaeus]WKD36551.1 WhiB family transcriptional regulator [Streptomyces xanthophaeus]